MRARVDLKPLSVNEAWKGRRYKTDEYKAFERAMIALLPNVEFECKGKLVINLTFGFSSRASDIDNPVKPILDCLQKKYKFNDNKIYKMTLNKEIVKAGDEFVELKINELTIV